MTNNLASSGKEKTVWYKNPPGSLAEFLECSLKRTDAERHNDKAYLRHITLNYCSDFSRDSNEIVMKFSPKKWEWE